MGQLELRSQGFIAAAVSFLVYLLSLLITGRLYSAAGMKARNSFKLASNWHTQSLRRLVKGTTEPRGVQIGKERLSGRHKPHMSMISGQMRLVHLTSLW